MKDDSSDDRVSCGKCGAIIAESRDTRPEDRQPCPRCGSTSRLFSVAIKGEAAGGRVNR
jgi:ribosomal protein S27AE